MERTSLWALEEKEAGYVESLDLEGLDQDVATRLREIGLGQGNFVSCLKILPFNGPKVFQVDDSVFSLEGATASKIFVSKRAQREEGHAWGGP